jgi:HPt (histidine-containing phosphotransfer) domain-containing protein
MDAFLLKPLSEEKIRAALADALRRRAEAAAEPAGLDLASLELYARTVAGGMAEAAQVYLRHLQEEIAALRAALDAGSAADLARAAHRVRSHAALIGAAELGRAAAELGQAALAGERAASADGFRRIERLAADAARQLKARVAPGARECA